MLALNSHKNNFKKGELCTRGIRYINYEKVAGELAQFFVRTFTALINFDVRKALQIS